MWVSAAAPFASGPVPICASLDACRMTKVKVKVSSSSLVNLRMKAGAAEGLDVSVSWTRGPGSQRGGTIRRAVEPRQWTTNLDKLYGVAVARETRCGYSGSRKCVGNDAEGGAAAGASNDERRDGHWDGYVR